MLGIYLFSLTCYVIALTLKSFCYDINKQEYIKFPNLIYVMLIVLLFIPCVNMICGTVIVIWLGYYVTNSNIDIKIGDSNKIRRWLSKKW